MVEDNETYQTGSNERNEEGRVDEHDAPEGNVSPVLALILSYGALDEGHRVGVRQPATGDISKHAAGWYKETVEIWKLWMKQLSVLSKRAEVKVVVVEGWANTARCRKSSKPARW